MRSESLIGVATPSFRKGRESELYCYCSYGTKARACYPVKHGKTQEVNQIGRVPFLPSQVEGIDSNGCFALTLVSSWY